MTHCIDRAVLVSRTACAVCSRTQARAIVIARWAILPLSQDQWLTSRILDRVEEWGVFVGLSKYDADAGKQYAQRALVHRGFISGSAEPLNCSSFTRSAIQEMRRLVNVFAPKRAGSNFSLLQPISVRRIPSDYVPRGVFGS